MIKLQKLILSFREGAVGKLQTVLKSKSLQSTF